ncbi:hypothetical protein AB0D04_07185 [Streptomyces sp. NPDC048483]|uniref:hypothetical protein n=1 Tax=Streptomyces sp. NPDC048483 TaxID=3154927 RepID=UPI00343F065E
MPAAPSRGFHRLTVADVRRETADTVYVAFDVPAGLAPLFRFVPGQHLTLKTAVDGEEQRRMYSICCGVGDGELRAWPSSTSSTAGYPPGSPTSSVPATRCTSPSPAGDSPPNPIRLASAICSASQRAAAFTPIASITKSVLLLEPRSRCTLTYGNCDPESTIFREELDQLAAFHGDRLCLIAGLLQFFGRTQNIGVVLMSDLDDTKGGFPVPLRRLLAHRPARCRLLGASHQHQVQSPERQVVEAGSDTLARRAAVGSADCVSVAWCLDVCGPPASRLPPTARAVPNGPPAPLIRPGGADGRRLRSGGPRTSM